MELLSNMTPWFQAHIWDVLSLSKEAGQLSQIISMETGLNSDDWPVFQQIAEHKLLMYAQDLSSFGELIPLAAQYLAWCPQYGREAMKQLIQQVPVQNDEVAIDVLGICKQYGIGSDQEATQLCQKRGMAHFEEGDYHQAVQWLAMANSIKYIKLVLSIFIKKIENQLISSIKNQNCNFDLETWGLEQKNLHQIHYIVDLLDPQNDEDQLENVDLQIVKQRQQILKKLDQMQFLEFVSKILREGQPGRQMEILTELILDEIACPDKILILLLDQLLQQIQERKKQLEQQQLQLIKTLNHNEESNIQHINVSEDFKLEEKQIEQIKYRLYRLEYDSQFIFEMAKEQVLKESLMRVQNNLTNMKFDNLF
eukprot:TRINITY_DN1830_c0_g3_i1.p1 TRINITY_DN1830_c0_g3~~TRINITY_DN1830_c0_g3_i1.p1  ORF type:complete len:367 (-),score=57.91 TRINITY_DN1830_c0_g3_i1:220-1320(-)